MTGLVKSVFISLEGRVHYINSRVLLFFFHNGGRIHIYCLPNFGIPVRLKGDFK